MIIFLYILLLLIKMYIILSCQILIAKLYFLFQIFEYLRGGGEGLRLGAVACLSLFMLQMAHTPTISTPKLLQLKLRPLIFFIFLIFFDKEYFSITMKLIINYNILSFQIFVYIIYIYIQFKIFFNLFSKSIYKAKIQNIRYEIFKTCQPNIDIIYLFSDYFQFLNVNCRVLLNFHQYQFQIQHTKFYFNCV